MFIAICDDEPLITEELSRLTLQYFEEAGIRARINTFADAESLLQTETRFDILLLDCRLPDTDGVELARRIMQRSPGSAIIFITAYPDYIFESYDVRHFKYILKPIDEQQLRKTFDDFFSLKNEQKPVFVMSDLSIPMNEISYIRANGSTSSVVTKNTVYNSRKTLRDYELELSPDIFMRVNRGVLVSLIHIKRHNSGKLTMDDGEVITVSRRAHKEFLRRFTKYLNSHC